MNRALCLLRVVVDVRALDCYCYCYCFLFHVYHLTFSFELFLFLLYKIKMCLHMDSVLGGGGVTVRCWTEVRVMLTSGRGAFLLQGVSILFACIRNLRGEVVRSY